MPRFEIERFDREEDVDDDSAEVFDRVAFALEYLALVRPTGTVVAVCEGARRIALEHGRQWGGPAGARWAMLMVPRTASRRAIARAILGLARAPQAWELDVLENGEGPYR